jgi:hypothetical protein
MRRGCVVRLVCWERWLRMGGGSLPSLRLFDWRNKESEMELAVTGNYSG